MKALIPVLKNLNISQAVSVDDDYSLGSRITPEAASTGINDFLAAYGDKLADTEKQYIEDQGAATLGDLFEEEAAPNELKAKISSLLKADDRSLAALSFLESAFQDTSIVYRKISDVYQIGDAAGQGTIWFLDKEIHGQDILPSAIHEIKRISEAADTPFLIVVFTSDDSFKEYNDSWDERYRYLYEECKLESDFAQKIAYSFFVISKHALREKLRYNGHAAAQYVEQIVIDSLGGCCVYYLLTRMNAYSQLAYTDLLDWSKNTRAAALENLYYNMLTEGASNAYQSIKAVHDLMQENVYTKYFEEVNGYVLAMRHLASLPKSSEEEICANAIGNIICQHDWAQFQFLHKDINAALSDVAYGDVFDCSIADSSTDDKHLIGVLITQPCDCIIRKNKGKTKRAANVLTLLLFKKQKLTLEMLSKPESKSDLSKWTEMIRRIRNRGIFIGRETHPNGEWTSYYIDASECCGAININPFILDLTSLDAEGKSKLKSEEEIMVTIEQKKTQNWKEYLPELKDAIDDFKKKKNTLKEKIADEAESFLFSIYGIPFSIGNQEFGICRIGRMEHNLTELVNYYYISKTYRTGKDSMIVLSGAKDEQGDA